MRIGLANVRPAASREESVEIVLQALADAGDLGAEILCFPECFVPVYRTKSCTVAVDPDWLTRAWAAIDEQAGRLGIAVILGTERVVDDALRITARVTNAAGACVGFQDKVQLDPSEEAIYQPGVERVLFRHRDLTFGVVICHEGWRYPETVRWAARRGAEVVFHPHYEIVDDPSHRPAGFADPMNTFHEKAALCRAAENHCYFASVNCAIAGATTTSAVIDPEGNLIAHQPYGEAGVLTADIDLAKATRFLAERFKPGGADTQDTDPLTAR